MIDVVNVSLNFSGQPLLKDVDLIVFPDVCLRILKYCKDDCDKETYERIARDAVDGFKTRIEAGDNYSGKLLAEAQTILDSIVGKKMMS